MTTQNDNQALVTIDQPATGKSKLAQAAAKITGEMWCGLPSGLRRCRDRSVPTAPWQALDVSAVHEKSRDHASVTATMKKVKTMRLKVNWKLFGDRTALLVTALVFSALTLVTARYFGEYFWSFIWGSMWISLLLDNHRLRKRLKELGHADDFASRVLARKK